ncbi:ABC transporter substrate-binding protein [Roseovarius aquimarinus]|uniref:PotD/PotF family extracellular solute-binding protein n=1 Tax=Roseovarius aquimarinus TaxID=1229156 RepID=A0ABW7I6A7_9RHOB
MHRKTITHAMTRRTLLQTSAAAGVAAAGGLLAAPAIAQARSLKVGAYGGYFENSFKEHVYPEFTKATGIEVESVTQSDSTGWMLTMQQAKAAGIVPADVSLFTPFSLIKGSRIGDLYAPFDPERIPNLSNLDEKFLHRDEAGLTGVAAMSFFYSMVINTDEVERPESWAEFWDTGRFEASLGLPKGYNWFFLDIIAATFFDGAASFETREGIEALIAKAAEIRPNVGLWYGSESQMEQALKNYDVVAGEYFHDVTGLMAADGHPVASIFPKEGNPISHNSWTLSPLSEKSDEAHEFVNFSCDPATQAIMSRKIGTAPVVDPSLTDLSQEELDAVSGTPTITPAYEAYIDNESFIQEAWNKMVAGA